MASSHAPSDPQNLPVPLTPRDEDDLDYFTKSWWSGTRGGGSVPKDFSWPTNPKENQEESGSGS
jgi:hypothetical protein